MSQGPSNPESKNLGKKRSQRIQLDYYRHRTWLDRFRIVAWSIGLVGSLIYAGLIVFQMQSGSVGDHVSTGPLTLAHAHFEQDCESCHQDFRPINPTSESDSLWASPLQRIGIPTSEWIAAQAEKCRQCHAVGGHRPGSLNQKALDVDQHCAHCHTDHQGRDHDLTIVSQAQCVECHHEPSLWTSQTGNVSATVTAFDLQNHPPFASLQVEDTGVIQFDHHQHGLPGQVPINQDGGMTLERLSTSDQARYRKNGQSEADLVQLQCADCHRMNGAASGHSADIEPISFERHCQACHGIESGVGGMPLPHAVDWKTLETALAVSIDGGRAIGQVLDREDNRRAQTMPGQLPATSPDRFSAVSPAELAAARKRSEQQCLLCHDPSSITDEAIAKHSIPATAPMIPSNWLSAGFYNHAAHSAIECRYCHADAYPNLDDPNDGEAPPTDHQRLMVGRDGVANAIGLCTDCHRGADVPTPEVLLVDGETRAVDPILGGMPTWGGDQCGICHRYHSPPTVPSASLQETAGKGR